MPSYRMYWSDACRFSPIADVMPRNRFGKLRNVVHLNDNSNMIMKQHPQYDPLFKVRPFLTLVQENLKAIPVEENHSIDEMIIPFKSRSFLKQYNKNKPHKWGMKVFVRAGASGMAYDFEVYIGKGTTKTNEKSSLGISGDIVVRLVQNLPSDQNIKIYFDNWFASYDLVSTLKEMGFWSVGTVRSNRIPGCQLEEDKTLKKERGSFDYRTEAKKNVSVVKWFDNKCVHLISSFIGCTPVENVRRWSVAKRQYIQVPQPAAVKTYNKHMGGVDLHDMLIELYRIDFRSKRYYLRIFFQIVDMCVINAWLLYRRHCEQQEVNHKPQLTFRSEVAHTLLQAGKSLKRKRGRPSMESTGDNPQRRRISQKPVDDVRLGGIAHWPQHVEEKQRCKFCIKAYSRTQCEKCGLALCLTKERNCFKDFHTT
ncbi:piggyBac transposable element-derived protein 3-like [Acipenser oxyrinchus oxyrinchus]|uniref:PiggyBac transposable element-derived protein 3-like n=1 Tax=Acipenser oxyrinchus oxyrinchus TaxID=40147 RepID=A0AAD8GA98_ACIOX|nr:piggyBac transposable element-derived protein 3-like [Acipenser oxyrinchus oxyrinchus]